MPNGFRIGFSDNMFSAIFSLDDEISSIIMISTTKRNHFFPVFRMSIDEFDSNKICIQAIAADIIIPFSRTSNSDSITAVYSPVPSFTTKQNNFFGLLCRLVCFPRCDSVIGRASVRWWLDGQTTAALLVVSVRTSDFEPRITCKRKYLFISTLFIYLFICVCF